MAPEPTRTVAEAIADPSVVSRFMAKADRGTAAECWPWRGGVSSKGYGRFFVDHRLMIPAHRFAYELAVGPIPDGLTIDHLCLNKLCVNPAHMEPVTSEENSRRYMLGSRVALCRRGHEMTPENVTMSGGDRYCRTCALDRGRRKSAARRARERAERLP